MDLEQTLRSAFVLREPATDFEDVVMARLAAGAWRASHAAPRRRRHMLLLGSLLAAAAAAAALLTVQHSGFSTTSAMDSVQKGAAVAPLVVQHATPVTIPAMLPAAPALAAIPPSAPGARDVSQLCAAAAVVPPAAPAYTVLMEPLQFKTDDSAIQSRVQEYYGFLSEQLRKVPGLGLVTTEAQNAANKPADYRVIVAMYNELDGKVISDPAAWQLTLKLQTWTGTSFGKEIGTSRQVRSLNVENCRSDPSTAFNCGPQGAAALDITAFYSRLPRYPTQAQAACDEAFQELIAQQRKVDPRPDISMARRGLERLATTPAPAARANTWSMVRNSVRPEMVPPLAAALRETTDDAFRKEVVTLLAVKFAGDPVAREALAAVAASSKDTLMRHVAERALSGDGPWRDHAVARLRDTGLPTDQRLEAWSWMADSMSLDKPLVGTGLADMLTALQERGGVPVLVDLLANTQRETGDGYGLAARQGQWTMRQIGSLGHPAAPDFLIACFDAVPNDLTLGVLATRRDDPRVASKLESIAATQADPQLRRVAASYLRQPLDPQQPAQIGN